MKKVYRSKYSEIFFYFPEESNLKLVPKKVLQMATEDKVNELMGYPTGGVFLKNYSYQLGTNKKKVKQPTVKDFEKIKDIIFEFEDKFNKILPKKNRGTRYFILPWYPNELESKKFDGSNATATYYRTVHIYIDITSYTKKGILKTLAHELNHLYFFDRRKDFNFSIKDMLIMEGLAEHFREYMVGGKVAPWSKALNDKQVLSAIKKVEPYFESTKREDYESIFFGSDKFKRWTGYAIGYYLVKKFIKKNKNLSWEKIMKTDVKYYF